MPILKYLQRRFFVPFYLYDADELFCSANSILTAEKRRLDGELRGLQQELDNLIVQMKNSEEKARKAMGDAGEIIDNKKVHFRFYYTVKPELTTTSE